MTFFYALLAAKLENELETFREALSDLYDTMATKK